MKVRELIKMIETDGGISCERGATIVSFTIQPNPVQSQQRASPASIFRRKDRSPKVAWNSVTAAGKPGVDIPPGTLNSILKQAGLKE